MHDHQKTEPSIILSIRFTALIFMMAAVALTACKPGNETTGAQSGPETYFPIGIGDRTLQLQLALTPAEHQKGLMFRESLAPDNGMLFLFPQPKQQSFWMKNTRLPLDIGYLDARGRLVEIHQLFPFDETGVTSRSPQILIAIETNRGWYAKNRITPGAQLDLSALKAAIRQRGLSSANYAIEE